LPAVKQDLAGGGKNATRALDVPQVWRTDATSVARKNSKKYGKMHRFRLLILNRGRKLGVFVKD
jgi:hypothetical protein